MQGELVFREREREPGTPSRPKVARPSQNLGRPRRQGKDVGSPQETLLSVQQVHTGDSVGHAARTQMALTSQLQGAGPDPGRLTYPALEMGGRGWQRGSGAVCFLLILMLSPRVSQGHQEFPLI